MLPLVVAILLVGCIVEAIFIILEQKKKLLAALLCKSAASFLFILAGVLAFQQVKHSSYAIFVLLGLVLGAVGDICLNLRFLVSKQAKLIFMLGIAAFLFGHVAYLFALAVRSPLALLYALPAAALLSYFVIRFVLKRVEVQGTIRTFGIVYLCIVVLMASCAVILFTLDLRDGSRALFAAGGILFAVSDVLLVLNQFGKRPYPAFRPLNLSLYYLGQACIALTIALAR